jgi:hypothetical protein
MCEFCPTDDGDCIVCDRHAEPARSERSKVLKVQVNKERLVMYAEGGEQHEVYAAPFGWCLASDDDRPSLNLVRAAHAARAAVWPQLAPLFVAEELGVA